MGPGLPHGFVCGAWSWYQRIVEETLAGDAGCTRCDGWEPVEVYYIDDVLRGTRRVAGARGSVTRDDEDVDGEDLGVNEGSTQQA